MATFKSRRSSSVSKLGSARKKIDPEFEASQDRLVQQFMSKLQKDKKARSQSTYSRDFHTHNNKTESIGYKIKANRAIDDKYYKRKQMSIDTRTHDNGVHTEEIHPKSAKNANDRSFLRKGESGKNGQSSIKKSNTQEKLRSEKVKRKRDEILNYSPDKLQRRAQTKRETSSRRDDEMAKSLDIDYGYFKIHREESSRKAVEYGFPTSVGSMYKSDYKKHRKVEKPIVYNPEKEAKNYKANPHAMDLRTTNKVDYKPFYIERRESTDRRPATGYSNSRFTGQSSYKDSFPDWGPVKTQTFKVPQYPVRSTEIGFAGESTYATSFHEADPHKMAELKKEQMASTSGARFGHKEPIPRNNAVKTETTAKKEYPEHRVGFVEYPDKAKKPEMARTHTAGFPKGHFTSMSHKAHVALSPSRRNQEKARQAHYKLSFKKH